MSTVKNIVKRTKIAHRDDDIEWSSDKIPWEFWVTETQIISHLLI